MEREYAVVVDWHNVVGLHKVTQYPYHRLLSSCSRVAAALASDKMTFRLYERSEQDQVLYLGTYRATQFGHFSAYDRCDMYVTVSFPSVMMTFPPSRWFFSTTGTTRNEAACRPNSHMVQRAEAGAGL